MSPPTPTTIRPLTSADAGVLREIVYYAIYVPEQSDPPPWTIVDHPSIAKYVRQWGRDGDMGFAAVDADRGLLIGAAWIRLLKGDEKGYGYVDDEIPELTVALVPGYRGQGIGTRLLTRLLDLAQPRYPGVSLSVSVDNPARRLYERLGFELYKRTVTSLTMVKRY